MRCSASRSRAFLVVTKEFPGESKLRVHCARNLSHHKIPRQYRFVASLPKTATGQSSQAPVSGGSIRWTMRRAPAVPQERFGGYHDGIGPHESLEGIVDSLGLFELVDFLEERFQVAIPNEEFSPKPLRVD